MFSFAAYFRFYSLSNILNLGKSLFRKPTFEKMPFFPTKNLANCFLFGSFNFRWFRLVVFEFFYYHHSSRFGNDFATVFIREGNSFMEKQKVSAFFAKLTPVSLRNECQKTFGENQRSVCSTLHASGSNNSGRWYTCTCEKISNLPMEDSGKQDFC